MDLPGAHLSIPGLASKASSGSRALLDEWPEGGQIFSGPDHAKSLGDKGAPGIVSGLTYRSSGGHQPVAPHFLGLYGLDSTREPPETEACALDLRRRDRPMIPSEPALVPTRFTPAATPASMAPSEPALVPTQLTPAPTPAPFAPAGSSQYEFSYSENSIIGNLGSKMSFVGLFMLGIGLFFFVSVIIRWVQSHHLEVALLFLTLLFIVVGIWTHRAGRGFRSVAETQGKDISHLMGALENLLKLYTLLYLLFFIALVFAIIQLGAHGLYG
jgi:hypothetical protein